MSINKNSKEVKSFRKDILDCDVTCLLRRTSADECEVEDGQPVITPRVGQAGRLTD